MQSKTSWFNKELLIQSIRSVGWVGIVYFVGLFFVLPLQIIMIFTNEQAYIPRIESLFSFQFEIQLVFIFLIPVLLAIFLFRFLQVKQSSDMIHSLPIKRERIYNHHMLLGVLFLVVPVVITAIFVFIVGIVLDLDQYYTLLDVVNWSWITLVFDLIIFSSSVFVGMLTGISAVQAVLTYILLLFPAGFSALLVYNLKYFFYGFSYDYYLNKNLENISPITRASTLNYPENHFTLNEALVYVGISILFYFAAVFLYKNRKLEAVSQALVFRGLRPVFKYGVTFCMMLFGGLYFGDMQNNLYWTMFGYVAGSVVGYLIAEMVLQKTWRVFTQLKGFVVYAVVMIVVVAGFQFDFTGYEKRGPDVNTINRVYFADNSYFYREKEKFKKGIYEEIDNIIAIQEFHKQLIDDKQKLENPNTSYQKAVFIYELKNGKKTAREYPILDTNDYAAYYQPIFESDEYKEMYYDVVNIDRSTVDKITVSPSRGSVARRTVIANPEKIQEAINVLREEVHRETYEDITDPRDSWGYIELLLQNDERVQFGWRKSYSQFESWLETNNLLQDARVFPEDIRYVLVMEQEDNGGKPYQTISHEELIEKFNNNENTIKVVKKDKIELILRNSSYWRGEGAKYLLALYFENDEYPDIRAFDEKYVPDFIKRSFD